MEIGLVPSSNSMMKSTSLGGANPSLITRQTLITQETRTDPKSETDPVLDTDHALRLSMSLSNNRIDPCTASRTPLLPVSIPHSVEVEDVGVGDGTTLAISTTVLSREKSHHNCDPNVLFIDLLRDKISSHTRNCSHSGSVQSSPKLLAQILSTLISSNLPTPQNVFPNSRDLPLFYEPVSRIVKDDFLKGNSAHLGGEVYIYLINLGPQSHPYAYSYGGDGGGDSSSPSFTRCLGSVWTGKERYIWIDLAAGPVNYGPALSGDGVLPRGEFHPLAAVHGPPKSEKVVLADLASLIWSAYQVLLVPSLRIPVTLEKTLVVQFIHVYGSEEKDLRGLNWDNIERTFMDEAHDGGLLLKDQTLRFRTYHVNYNVCPVCSFAISRATNSYTSRFFFQNYTLIVSEYLDSKRLHQTLQESDDELKRAAGILDQEEDFGRVIPVYVFDLDYNRHLMLDRYHQSVAFKDMVIAVRTRSSQTVSDYNCNGRHVITQTRELERPIVGSILQSTWGVSPTHLVWSSRHNSTMVDYTWSVGQTPFGPFSETSSLSFVQRDAARRNVLLTTLNYTITSAIEVLESISAHGGDRHLLKQGQHVVFVERWNLLKYKLDKAVSALSHSDFEMASYFIRSSDHDLFAIHALIYQASQELEATFTCFKDPPFPWASVAMLSFGFVAFFYVYARRDRIFRSKRKQF
ncbi:hypothetical protein Scep_021867 [Stephania cephalantha]|uniref:DUF7906 domain-containing protein n=1 Tax=Stephania cephalantha TaxID=152367 RepID=A0AAP0FCL4_9MAGN